MGEFDFGSKAPAASQTKSRDEASQTKAPAAASQLEASQTKPRGLSDYFDDIGQTELIYAFSFYICFFIHVVMFYTLQ